MRAQKFRGNVFVANLPPEISDEQLAEAFDAFGIVLSATVAHDPETGKRLRYGFVDIATERAAKLAVASMNGAAIDGYNLDVRISERPVTAKKPRAAGVFLRSPSSRQTSSGSCYPRRRCSASARMASPSASERRSFT